MEQIAYNDIKPFLNETFHLEVAPRALMDVDLVSVDSLGVALDLVDGQADDTAFAVVFRSQDAEDRLIQRSYTLSHPEMGDIEAFLVSIGSDEIGMRYEAVFT